MVRRAAPRPAGTLLAFGNPALGLPLDAGRVTGAIEPLPEAESQARRLAEFYGAGSRAYVGAEALEARWKHEASSYRVLHLATHGVVDDRSPMYSYVLLAPSTGPEGEDGLVEAREIVNLRLNADLVVLSACETARGRVAPGEGVIGLMWSFFIAGAPATLVSQWKVESASSTQLMVGFHQRWNDGRNGLSKARALQQAAIEMRRTRQWGHPFYWSGYILVGDGR
jgi:CHAT domain-containing protein